MQKGPGLARGGGAWLWGGLRGRGRRPARPRRGGTVARRLSAVTAGEDEHDGDAGERCARRRCPPPHAHDHPIRSRSEVMCAA